MAQLYYIFQCKNKLDALYEPEQLEYSYDELKFQLLKLSLVYDSSLSKLEKATVQKCLPVGIDSFEQMIDELRESMIRIQEQAVKLSKVNSGVSTDWIGTRQEVELPVKNNDGLKPKDIMPELLNKDFLWTESYHHYDDWKSKMEGVYDQFNLLQIPHANKNAPKFYFDHNDFKRRVPKGIFPFPNHKRTMLEQPQQLLQTQTEA